VNEVDTPEPSRKKIKSYRRHGSRYKARRRGVDILYEAESRDVDPVAIVQDRVELSVDNANQVAPVSSYTQQIVAGVAEELDQIDEVISIYLSTDWELHRISAVDRAILRVAVWELIFNEEVPLKTVLSEAVELAAQYSGAKAPAYINAVLDSAVKDIDELRAQPATPDDSEELSFEEALEAAEQLLDDAEAAPASVAATSADAQVSQPPVSDDASEELEQMVVPSDARLVDSAQDLVQPEAEADVMPEPRVIDADASGMRSQSEGVELSEQSQVVADTKRLDSAVPQSHESEGAESDSEIAETEAVIDAVAQEPSVPSTEGVAANDTESGENSASAREEDS
jgi:hypothetical protein